MINLFTLEAGAGAGTTGGLGGNPMSLLMLVAMFAAMYFFVMRPQKKRQKEEQEMRDSIQIGDEITTIGGIVGRVVVVKDDSVVLETGPDRSKIKFKRAAIQTNETANARMAEEKKAAEEAKKAKSEKDAIDKAVNGKSKKTKTVENKGSAQDLKADEEAKKDSEE
ncbi:MAG: preprotein translocase subunit YajC [Clostridia bacterium]|nr:preprotein translocase subunit YajC [Clostridia bacterium]